MVLFPLSNKLERLLEMTDEVISNGEKVLIFTQFTQMGTIIKKILYLQWQDFKKLKKSYF